jgi:1-acyl-sn-glycerol-3-phosphate acyltransferase
MAKEELFKVPVLGRIIRSLDAFPVKRGEGDTEALRHTISQLEAGKTVLVFPEGTRGDGVSIQPVNRGVTMLARRTGATVVPVGIIGTHKVLPKGQSRWKRHKITVAFGRPFKYQDITAANEREAREVFANELQARILEVCRANGLDLKTAPSNLRSEESAPAETPA